MCKDLNEKKLNHSTVSVAGLQGLFLPTNPSYFRRPLKSLLLRYTAENLQVTQI